MVKPSKLPKSVTMSSRLPFWRLLANVDSGPKVERELRTFSNRLRRHHLGEGVISLNEHSTNLLSDMVCASYIPKCYFVFPFMVHIQQKAECPGCLSTTTFSRAGYGSKNSFRVLLMFYHQNRPQECRNIVICSGLYHRT